MAIFRSLLFLLFSLFVRGEVYDHTVLDPVSFEDSTTPAPSGLVLRCFWLNIESMAVFDINKLKNKDGYSFIPKENISISYNFCANAVNANCTSKESQVLSNNLTSSTCVEMTSSYTKSNTWQLLNSSNASEGLKITLRNGNEKCKDVLNYTLIYELICNPAVDFSFQNPTSYDPESCTNTLRFQSKEACPNLDILSMVKFFSDNYIIFSIIIILLGLFELILGAKILVITIYIISCITIVTVVFIFIMQFIVVGNDKPGVFWAVLAISAVAGIVMGFVIARYKKTVIGFILGGYSGYIVGTLIYSSFLNRIDTTVPLLVNIATIIGCIIVFVLIAYFLFDHVVIFSTSLIGAYGVIRGIGTLVGNFPNEIIIMKLISSGETEQWNDFLTWWVIGYLIGWGVFFIGGVIVQYVIRTKTDDDKDTDGKKKDKHLLADDKKAYWLN